MVERLQQRQISRRTVLAGLAAAACSPLGCFAIGKPFAKKEETKPAPQGRLVSTWDKKVVYAPDPFRGGAISPGIVGRVYLFGPDVTVPYIGDGSLKIDIWDSTPRGPHTGPIFTDFVAFDAGALKAFAKKDFVGDGYTIFCPWASYRPDIAQIYIILCYTTAAGVELFHQSGTFAINHSDTSERVKKEMNAVSSRLVN